MVRTVREPPFPIDLGSWLENFRHRRRNFRGHTLSPERVGQEIGVSGATIRRWEAGQLLPRPSDLVHLSAVYHLTPNQDAFLKRALRSRDSVAPAPEVFRKRATSILTGPFPAYIMDSLYYIRAWNSHMKTTLAQPVTMFAGKHVIEQVLELERGLGPDDPPQRRQVLAERLRWLTREFWYYTADLCRQPAYRQLVLSLAESESFKKEWRLLPFLEADEEQILGLPQPQHREDIGGYRLTGAAALIPPTYLLHEFIPMDEKARETVEMLRKQGPPEVYFGSISHWAEQRVPITAGANPD